MNYDTVIIQAISLVWRNKMLWGLGLLATVSGLVTNFILRFLLRQESGANFLQPGNLGEGGAFDFLKLEVVLALVLLVLLFFLSWFINAIAEGGLIRATTILNQQGQLTFGQALRRGWRLLSRFIAIDSLLFLPIFILFIALLLVSFGGLIGLVAVSTQGFASPSEILVVLGVTSAGATAIICLIIPVGLLIILMRIIAFREAAVNNMTPGNSIRRAWHIVRSNLLSISFLGFLLVGFRYLLGAPFKMISFILTAVSVSPWIAVFLDFPADLSVISAIAGTLGLVVPIIVGLLNAILYAFVSSSWTLGYLELTAADSQTSPLGR
jgi:hypothetical protein